MPRSVALANGVIDEAQSDLSALADADCVVATQLF